MSKTFRQQQRHGDYIVARKEGHSKEEAKAIADAKHNDRMQSYGQWVSPVGGSNYTPVNLPDRPEWDDFAHTAEDL